MDKDEVDMLRTERDLSLQRPKRREIGERWIARTDGSLPPEPTEPFLAGSRRFDGKFHYVGRYRSADVGTGPAFGSFVGPLVENSSGGFGLLPVPKRGDRVAPLQNFEVLVVSNNSVEWKSVSREGNLPNRPVPGILKKAGNIYIGKREDVGVGMVCRSSRWLFYSHRSSEPYADNFKVLCYSNF